MLKLSIAVKPSYLVALSRPVARAVHSSAFARAKGDTSSIDSFRLPSQTSINEWEFKYDFIPKTAEPKVPPLTKEAVKQDIAQNKAKQVERELFTKESNSSIKVEANSADVFHGGESVGAEPEFLHDKGSKPVDSSTVGTAHSAEKKTPVNREKYIQSSVNPVINDAEVVSYGDSEVSHKTSEVDKQTPVVEDIEHDNLHHAGAEHPEAESSSSSSSSGYTVPLVLVLGGGAGYYYYSSSEKK
ncbi:hypothetical protein PICST_31917 [Scheffersomyces stipitis CBS 6054]|uniref:Uncharacterized protein n=1 Tax=Scheffersomyces stipitis (strain ATCC 58785 / CBS 6054 / NBRC 10063 / NRRL Y-11545) TaxID=322104 RepID=A3LUX0_PICST|nr:hypothetical protein PICST_31917 [Scheffersomyces stipitis CBS 6054]ABN67028.2 hypothetical protein PICST_31917 [Scheffersomyces stipitis CBS 6054]KAG2731282.1 hypothetical protein G9P44_005698 [Scheffersomyces stipitis]